MGARGVLMQVNKVGKKCIMILGPYSAYTENMAKIGRYNTENGSAWATRHFTRRKSRQQQRAHGEYDGSHFVTSSIHGTYLKSA